ncbi:MAG: chromosome segregation protein SMC [Firmicutes bacterium]|nr:chromosome segregation protein SMC [Bacillota bacterium]
MKFKELEVFGFKSFADKLAVRFGGGITAIVGPNGCGKSNVADAIRWVLGEQSPKLLRGKSMQDVIFNGTEKRKQLSYCEVVLKFDNKVNPETNTRMFSSLEYNEVTISRKLYRSGESSYYINNQDSRLKDIAELLRDGGMGREGYSIIGQGRIDELLSAKPENRRAIFEEAAGISKYKVKKVESERKLIRIRENLIRIEDILSEKGKVLEPLTQQAEKARKCLDLRDKLKEHEINIYIHQRDTSEQIKGNISGKLTEASEELNQKESEFNQVLLDYKAARDKYESSDADLNAYHERLTLLNVGLEKQQGEINNLKQRQEFMRQNMEKIEEENDIYEMAVQRLEGLTAQKEIEKISAQSSLASANENYKTQNAEYLLAVDLLNENAGRIAEEREAEIAAMDKLSEIKSNLTGLKTEKQMLERQVEENQKEIRELLSSIKITEKKTSDSSTETDKLITQKEKETAAVLDYSKQNEKLTNIISISTDKLADISRQYYSSKSRFQLLKDMKEAREGFAAGVKNLLKNAKNDKRVAEKIDGVVAELIKVDAKFETAIEVALGNAYQNVVVSDEENANVLIEYLKLHRLGRVTFMPITAAKPRQIDAKFLDLLKIEGCFGVASDLIKFDPKYKTVMQGYLGGTVITDTAETATKISKQTRFAFKIVTLEGEVFATNGSITGGNFKTDKSISNIFSHEREIGELDTKIKEFDNAIAILNKDKTAAEKDIVVVAEKIKLHTKNVHALELSITTQMETLNHHMSDMESLRKDLDGVNTHLSHDSARIEQINNDLNSVSELEEFLANKRKEATQCSRAESEAYETARANNDVMREKISELRIEINRLDGIIERNTSELDRFKQEIEDNKLRINSNNITKSRLLSDIARTEENINEISKRASSSDTQSIKEVKEKIAGIDTHKKELAASIDKMDSERERLGGVLQALRDKKTQCEFQLMSVDTEIEAKEQRLLEDYNLNYETCQPFRQDEYDINKGIGEANKLKRQIYNLGDVNIGAIEQVKTAYEEYNQYQIDRDDIIKAEADLLKIIKDLSGDMLRMFNENFEKIRVNFVQTFKALFDGGNADLYLTEAEDGDPLSSGIEIVAQPPQKKLQSITLLSGGERALTAIAILFAILKLKPMPFCVLDEIEAALDDANAGRFAKYLRRFSEGTQFIVITHRKPTMELSDSLYGVTMEEKGVSKIVSVKLSDAVSMGEISA